MVDSLVTVRRNLALEKWVSESKKLLTLNYPNISFEDDVWAVPNLVRRRFNQIKKACVELHLGNEAVSVFRCLMVEETLEKRAVVSDLDIVYRDLLRSGVTNIFSLLPEHFDATQNYLSQLGQGNSHSTARTKIKFLELISSQLCEKGITDFLWYPDPTLWATRNRRTDKATRLENWYMNAGGYTNIDHRIAAFTDLAALAFTPASDRTDVQKSVFGPREEQATLIYMLKLCVPARINEVLSMKVNDVVDMCDYEKFPLDYSVYLDGKTTEVNDFHKLDNSTINLHRAQQQFFERHLVILQKGSKGGRFGAKPVLRHMIDLCHAVVERLTKMGARSRMLANYYENNPDELYYPPGFEYLKDKSEWTLSEIHRITHFTEPIPETGDREAKKQAMKRVHWVFTNYFNKGKNKKSLLTDLQVGSCMDPVIPPTDGRKKVTTYDSSKVKEILLAKVKSSMEAVRNVTQGSIQYHEKLSELLCLSDSEYQAPYLIGGWDAGKLQTMFAKSNGRTARRMENIFDRLGIRMIQFDDEVPAWIDSHDFRRFITDNALECKNAVEGMRKISDVVINSWARRKDITQLSHYRRPFSETQAHSVILEPSAHQVKLMEDLDICSEVINSYDNEVKKRAKDRGLTTFTYHTNGGDVTLALSDSLNRAHAGIDALGKVRTMIPLRHGSCLHDHAVNPCQHIVKHCFGCDQRVYTKGDEHRHAQVQKIYKRGFDFLLLQIERYIDDLEASKISQEDATKLFPMLLNRDLDPVAMTKEVIDLFEFQYERLKEWPVIFNAVEEVFVAKANLNFEEDERYKSGDTMRYLGHNKSNIRSEIAGEFTSIESTNKILEAEIKATYGEKVAFIDTRLSVAKARSLLNKPFQGSGEDEEVA